MPWILRLHLSLFLAFAACGDASSDAPRDAAAFDASDAFVETTDGATSSATCTLVPGWTPSSGCNGDPASCNKRFNDVAVLTTHNSFSTADDHFIEPNQQYCTLRQLQDGVRGFMLDVHDDNGAPAFCHGFCGVLGHTPLVQGLSVFKRYLDQDPNAVITFILETYVEPSVLVSAFNEAGLTQHAFAHQPSEPWPTLQEMIDADKRLVVLTDSDAGGADWLLYVWDHASDNPYEGESPEQMRCEGGRGMLGKPLFIFNHFLTQTFGQPELAEMVNHNPFFHDRVASCAQTRAQKPNFVTVDFYDIGDGFEVVNGLNASWETQ